MFPFRELTPMKPLRQRWSHRTLEHTISITKACTQKPKTEKRIARTEDTCNASRHNKHTYLISFNYKEDYMFRHFSTDPYLIKKTNCKNEHITGGNCGDWKCKTTMVRKEAISTRRNTSKTTRCGRKNSYE